MRILILQKTEVSDKLLKMLFKLNIHEMNDVIWITYELYIA